MKAETVLEFEIVSVVESFTGKRSDLSDAVDADEVAADVKALSLLLHDILRVSFNEVGRVTELDEVGGANGGFFVGT